MRPKTQQPAKTNMMPPKRFACVIAALLALGPALVSQDKAALSPSQSGLQQTEQLPTRVRVSSTTFQKMIVTRVNPQFTKEQVKERKKKRIQGLVHVLLVIAPSGDLSEVKAIDGDPLLANVTIAAVKQWKFHPYLLNGKPVEVENTLVFNFPLND